MVVIHSSVANYLSYIFSDSIFFNGDCKLSTCSVKLARFPLLLSEYSRREASIWCAASCFWISKSLCRVCMIPLKYSLSTFKVFVEILHSDVSGWGSTQLTHPDAEVVRWASWMELFIQIIGIRLFYRLCRMVLLYLPNNLYHFCISSTRKIIQIFKFCTLFCWVFIFYFFILCTYSTYCTVYVCMTTSLCVSNDQVVYMNCLKLRSVLSWGHQRSTLYSLTPKFYHLFQHPS